MSDQPKEKPYVYQSFGIQNKEHWKEKRIYAVATDSWLTTISGLTKEEAERVLWAMKTQPTTRPTIAELDAILNSEDDVAITINPDGSITAA